MTRGNNKLSNYLNFKEIFIIKRLSFKLIKGDVMKYILTFIFCLFITTSASFAQSSDKSVDRAVKAYLTSLNSSNPGVVESTIENVMVLKVYHPEKDMSQIIQKLDELNLGKDTKTIRVKAFIAANYLKNPHFITENFSHYPWQAKLIKINNPELPVQELVNRQAIKELLNSVDNIWSEKTE
jgi:hypothetical protein